MEKYENCIVLVKNDIRIFSLPACLKKNLGQGKKTKFPVSSYYHIYGWGVILG